MIKLHHVQKSFTTPVLHDVSFRVAKGSTVGLVGLNGAGKTTLLRLLLGLYAPTKGTVEVIGVDPRRAPSSFYQKIGVVGGSDGFNGNLTFLENLLFYGSLKGQSQETIEAYASTQWPHLLGQRRVKLFSKGERMQCALARAFLGDSELFILDEPTVALDYEGYQHFEKLVHMHQKRGATFIISSHNLETIESLCHSVLHLADGYIETIDFSSFQETFTIRCSDVLKVPSLISSLCEIETIEKDFFTCKVQGSNKISEVIALLVTHSIAVYEVRKQHSVSALLQKKEEYGTL